MSELDDELARLGRELEAAQKELKQLREQTSGEQVSALKQELATLESFTRTDAKNNAELERKRAALEVEAKKLRGRLGKD